MTAHFGPRPSTLRAVLFSGGLSKLHQRDSVFSQDAVDAQKANQIYRETVEKANVAILEAKKKLEMSRELIEGNELESHDEKIKVMKENQNQGWFPSTTKRSSLKWTVFVGGRLTTFTFIPYYRPF